MKVNPEDRALTLRLIASLTLADHLGDVGNDIDCVLELLGVEYEDDEDGDGLSGVRRALHALGVRTLNGTEIWSTEEDEE